MDYLALKWGKQVVLQFWDNLQATERRIQTNPFQFMQHEEDYRKVLIDKNNWLIYRVTGNPIYVLSIYGTRQKPKY